MVPAARFACTFGLLALTGATAAGHDLWLIPPEAAAAKKPVRVQASVGMDFPVSVFAADTERYPAKFVVGPEGAKLPLASAGKKDLLALLEFTPEKSGIHAVAVETRPKIIELEADRFNEYLVTDGLPHIFRLRAKEKTLDQPAVERYRKSPKALVRVGDGNDGPWDKVLGLPLEIIPQHNPFLLKVGETLKVRVLFQGKALEGGYLGWQRPGDGDTPIGVVRTDARGEALVPISQLGLMTLRLTHMTRPKAADHEWESFWTTLTFRIP
jgi:uncharacterized GH25 family protein